QDPRISLKVGCGSGAAHLTAYPGAGARHRGDCSRARRGPPPVRAPRARDPEGRSSPTNVLAPRRFGPLRDTHSRPYLITAGLSMMADNIEHVITYWVLWEVFASPWLVGFQVISHWLPFLLFSVLFGGLAEKYDCRRIIQAAQILFALVSLSWGLLFVPALLLLLGPAHWIFASILFYRPMTVLMARTPFTGHVRSGHVHTQRVSILDTPRVLRTVGGDRVLVGMIALAGLIAVCV